MTLEIADCYKRVNLDFDVDSDEARVNSLHKLDTLITALRVFRKGVGGGVRALRTARARARGAER